MQVVSAVLQQQTDTTEAISNTEKISKISDPFVILIERLYTLYKYPKVEICMILMTLIFNLIKVTLNRMTLMQYKFLDLRY